MDAPISSPTMSSGSTQQSSPSQSFVPPPPREHKSASTETFIRDLNLVAEAAKRAQMACLMRDLESVGIS